jgi:hypothetical protein
VTPRLAGATAATVAAAAIAAAGARVAHAQSFVQRVSEDPCQQVMVFDAEGDTSPAADHARRSCRLQAFSRILASERQRKVQAEQQAREDAVGRWVATTQPMRVQRPLAVEVFVGTGVATYGAAFSWAVLRQLELAARVGRREMNCSDMFGGLNEDCTRTLMGGGARWMLTAKDFTPFIGGGFAVTNAALKVFRFDPMTGGSTYLAGNGRAHSVSASAGLQLSVAAVRLSLEYVLEYVYYTGANLEDPQKTPSKELTQVWQDSLDADRHGVRLQVGIAF